jgi:hypothetical protein
MELVYDNFRAFQCSLLDYENILTIYRARPNVQGMPRTIKTDEQFENYLIEILLGNNNECCVVGVEDIISKLLISFSIYSFPKNSQFGFLTMASSIPKDVNMPLTENSGAVSLLRLGVMIGKERNVFDIFSSVKLTAYLPLCRVFNSFESLTGQENISYWMLHKVVSPNDPLTTSIEKYLLGSSFIERKHPIAIIHTSLKEKFRVSHYKHNFSVSEETLMRCTVPNYACSTSTTTSVGTSS